MELIQTIVLGIVQGITELLPISSTAHMLLVSEYIFHNPQTLLFLTTIQFGTTIAIFLVFKDFIFKDVFKKEKLSLYLKVLIGTVPAIVFGILVEPFVEKYFYTKFVIALSLLLWGIAMIFVEKRNYNVKTHHLTDVTLKQAIIVGLAQAVAIIPGTSRSGSTTVVGILTGLEKFVALEFSFLLGLPVLVGSFIFELYKYRDNIEMVLSTNSVIGIIVAGIVGFASIVVLRKFSKSNFLTFFGYYRILLAIIIFITII